MASLAVVLPAAAPVAAASANVGYPVAQTLADRLLAENCGIIDAIVHVSPTPDARSVAIAVHLRTAYGEASGNDDLGVARTGAPLVEVTEGRCARLSILAQLRDCHRRPIGVIGMMDA